VWASKTACIPRQDIVSVFSRRNTEAGLRPCMSPVDLAKDSIAIGKMQAGQ
jgi:hypothetical protein